MDPAQRPESFELADYTGVLRRRWWLIAGMTLVGLVLAAAYTVIGPKTYTATSSVAIAAPVSASNSQSSGAHSAQTIVTMDNDAQIVQSDKVAGAAARLMGSQVPARELAKNVSVTVPPNTQVLHIHCRATQSATAAKCANAFAEAFLTYQRSSITGPLRTQISTVQEKARALQAEIVALRDKQKSLRKGSPRRDAMAVQIGADLAQLRALNLQIGPLYAEESNATSGTVITPAAAPASPSSPRKLLTLPSGLVAGLLIGLALGFIADRRDKRVHDEREVERLLNLPVLLGSVPGAPGSLIPLAPAMSAAGHRVAEFAHGIVTALGEGNHVVAVVGTGGRGTSVVAANLATSLARARSEAILVCAVPGAATPALFGLGPGTGLAELAARRASIAEATQQPSAASQLGVITAGIHVPEGLSGLPYDRAQQLVSELRREARYVVVELSAATYETDTFTLAGFADAALIVVETGKTTHPAVAECLRRLYGLRTTVLGAAVLPAVRRTYSAPSKPTAPAPFSLPSNVAVRSKPPVSSKPTTQPADRHPPAKPRPLAEADEGGSRNSSPFAPQDPADSSIRN